MFSISLQSWTNIASRFIVIAILAAQVYGLPMVTRDINDTLHDMMPVRGFSLADEIKCYSLPYGLIGFVSHLLTYYTLLTLGYQRRPYAPWVELSHSSIDIILSVCQVTISIGIASFTMYRCIERWQFVCIAVWKLVLSIEVGVWGFSAAWKAREASKNKTKYKSLHPRSSTGAKLIWSKEDWTPYTIIFYAAGYAVGMVGLLALAWELRKLHDVFSITLLFFGVTVLVLALCVFSCLFACCFDGVQKGKILMAMAFTCILVGALYSDWVLAAIAGSSTGVQNGIGTTHGNSWLGFPSGDHAVLYWTYFVAKRLPMLFS